MGARAHAPKARVHAPSRRVQAHSRSPQRAANRTAITAGPDGNLWFTEEGANKIGRITPSGRITEFPIPTASSGPDGITAGPDGNLWFTEGAANKIGRITPTGAITEFPIPTAESAPVRDHGGPRRQPLVHRGARQQDRADHPERRDHRVPDPHSR